MSPRNPCGETVDDVREVCDPCDESPSTEAEQQGWCRATVKALAGQIFGSLVLVSALWQLILLARGLATYPRSFVLWLDYLAFFPSFLLGMHGSIYLLRKQKQGYGILLVTVGISLVEFVLSVFGGAVPTVPLISICVGPGMRGRVKVLAINLVCGIILLLLKRDKKAVPEAAPWGMPIPRWSLIAIFAVIANCLALKGIWEGSFYAYPPKRIAGTRSSELPPQGPALLVSDEQAAEYAYTWIWSRALVRRAEGAFAARDLDEAEKLYQEVLRTNFNDLVPTGNPWKNVDIDDPRHDACIVLSKICEGRRDFDSALKYAILARDRYPFFSNCNTCYCFGKWEEQRHIDFLREELEKGR